MGDVDQVGLRSGPLVLSEVWQPDEDRVVHRTASGRRDRRAPQTLPLVSSVGPRASPDADGLVQEVDSTSSDQLQKLTYMDTLLDTLKSSLTHVALRLNCGVHPCFVCIELQFVLK